MNGILSRLITKVKANVKLRFFKYKHMAHIIFAWCVFSWNMNINHIPVVNQKHFFAKFCLHRKKCLESSVLCTFVGTQITVA